MLVEVDVGEGTEIWTQQRRIKERGVMCGTTHRHLVRTKTCNISEIDTSLRYLQ